MPLQAESLLMAEGSVMVHAAVRGALGLALVAAPQMLTLDEVLFRANEAVVAYEKHFSNVVAEERYVQRLVDRDGKVERERVTLSDFLLIRLPGAENWNGFRDVLEVDGKPIGDRQARLEKLFLESPRDAFERAKELADDSARYNIGRVPRRVTVPTLAILVLHSLNQHRFHFEKIGEERVGETQTWAIRYAEHLRPTIVRSGGVELFARGTLWIDPDSGRLARSVMILGDLNTPLQSTITVTYQPDAALGLWVPVEMEELYDNPRDPEDQQVHAVATYSNFRQFQVGPMDEIGRTRYED